MSTYHASNRIEQKLNDIGRCIAGVPSGLALLLEDFLTNAHMSCQGRLPAKEAELPSDAEKTRMGCRSMGDQHILSAQRISMSLASKTTARRASKSNVSLLKVASCGCLWFPYDEVNRS